MTLREAYLKTKPLLKNPEVEEINLRIFLCEINGLKNMTDFYVHENEEVKDLAQFYLYLQAFLRGEPIQYILRKTEFYGINLHINMLSLIPRQESEEVVDFCIKKAQQIFGEKPLDIVDVCCGCGNMGIALSKHLKTSKLFLSDIDAYTLDNADYNVRQLNIPNAEIVEGNCLENIKQKADVVIANPPYILNKDEVDESAAKYESPLALYTTPDLPVYRGIIKDLPRLKKDKLLAVFEIGYDLREKLTNIVKEYLPGAHFEFHKDINGKERILSIIL